MRKSKHKKAFPRGWMEGRPWLRHDETLAKWCAICHKHRNEPTVAGPARRRNTLGQPMTLYQYRNVPSHTDAGYHLAAVALSTCFTTPVSNLPIQLPVAVILQFKVMFHIVLYMTKVGVAHTRLKGLHEKMGVISKGFHTSLMGSNS